MNIQIAGKIMFIPLKIVFTVDGFKFSSIDPQANLMAKLQISWPNFFRSSCSAVGDFGAGCAGCAAGAVVAGAAGPPGSWDFLRCKVTRPAAGAL